VYAPINQMLASGYIYVTLLYRFCRKLERDESRSAGEHAYSANLIEKAVIYEAPLQTVLITRPAPAIAVTNGAPCRTNTSAAAREEKIVVQLVLLHSGTPATDKPAGGGALKRHNHSGVIRGGEDVSTEAVCIRFPAKRVRLSKEPIVLDAKGE
jgi:hypothetical protein